VPDLGYWGTAKGDMIATSLRGSPWKSESGTWSNQNHGLSGDSLHEDLDRMAVAGADKESDDKDILYPGGRGQETVFNWVDNASKPQSHT